MIPAGAASRAEPAAPVEFDPYQELVRQELFARAAAATAPTRAARRAAQRRVAQLERKRVQLQLGAYEREPLLVEAAVALRKRLLPKWSPRRLAAALGSRPRARSARPRRRRARVARRTSGTDPPPGDEDDEDDDVPLLARPCRAVRRARGPPR